MTGAFGIVMLVYFYHAISEAEYNSHTEELLDYLDANMGENVFATSVDIAELPSYGWQEIAIDENFETSRTYKIVVEG